MDGNSGDRYEFFKNIRGKVQMVKVITILLLGEHLRSEKGLR